MAQGRVQVFSDVSRYLRYNYFDVVWGYGPPRESRPKPKRFVLDVLMFFLAYLRIRKQK